MGRQSRRSPSDVVRNPGLVAVCAIGGVGERAAQDGLTAQDSG